MSRVSINDECALKHIDRRCFIKLTGLAGITTLMPAGILARQATAIVEYPNVFHRDGGLIILPDKGKIFISTDFHSRYSDFKKWLKQTDLIKKINYGEDVYGLILGDVVDKKADDNEAEPSGDARIIDAVMSLQNGSENGKRLIYIQGNHEYECIKLYERYLHEFQTSAMSQDKFVKQLYDSEKGDIYRQFNFVERMNSAYYHYLKNRPFATYAKNGIIGVHAGPSKTALTLKAIANEEVEVIKEILWTRPEEVKKNGYTKKTLISFLSRMSKSALLISGHTPLEYLPSHCIQFGIGFYGKNQLIIATSYGSEAEGGIKSFLALSLDKKYATTSQVDPKEEIIPLG